MSSTLASYFDRQIRVVGFDRLFDRCLREIGMNPASWTPDAFQLELVCDYIGERYTKAYEADWWPQLCPVVERDVDGDADEGYYVAYQQDDEVYMDAIRAVTDLNPALYPEEVRRIPYRLSQRGIELPSDVAAESVFVQFRLPPPKATKTAWSNATAYLRGDLAYAAGKVYRSLQDANTNHAVSDTEWWEPQFYPEMFVRYVAKGVYADWLRKHGDSQDQADRESGRAAAELERLGAVERDSQRQHETASAGMY